LIKDDGGQRLNAKRLFPFIVLCMTIATSLVVYGCTGVETTATEPGVSQYIHYIMQPAPLDGHSVVDYTKILKAGDEVSGYMMVTGLWEVEGDYTTPWTFEAWNPDGVLLDTATIHNWYEDAYHAFKFTATIGGEYIIRAIHISFYTRDLDIMISPPGWQLKEAETD
jgi:hypothetical protein